MILDCRCSEQVPPPVPTVVVIPTTPDLREAQGSGEWQDRVATPIQGPRQPGGLPSQFEYQPKHSAESDDKTVSGWWVFVCRALTGKKMDSSTRVRD